MDPTKPQLFGMGYGRVDYGANLNPVAAQGANNQQSASVQANMVQPSQPLAYPNMLPFLYSNQMMGLNMQPPLLYSNPFATLPSTVFNQNQLAANLSSLQNLSNSLLPQALQSGSSVGGLQGTLPNMLTTHPLTGLLQLQTPSADPRSMLTDRQDGHQSGSQSFRVGGDYGSLQGGGRHKDLQESTNPSNKNVKREVYSKRQAGKFDKSSRNKESHNRNSEGSSYMQQIDPATGKFRDRDEYDVQGRGQEKRRRASIEDSREGQGREEFKRYREERGRDDKISRDSRELHHRDRQQHREFNRHYEDQGHYRMKESFQAGNNFQHKRRESREREKPRYREKEARRDHSIERPGQREGGWRRDREFGKFGKDFSRDQKDRERHHERHHFNENEGGRDRKHRFEEPGEPKRLRDRHGEGGKADNIGKLMIITKPIDNIEGNSIAKDQPISYMCFDSNVPRRSTVMDMVRYKISKYFLPEQQPSETKSKGNEEEPEEFGLSDDEDLYHLTFKSRYYNDFVICQNCFKEGKTG